jgi:hypothetical protein
MGHSIQAMIASDGVAAALHRQYPALSCVPASGGLTILPVNAEFVDSLPAGPRSPASGDFALLTAGLSRLLLELPRHGSLAYVETDYFGGRGGQGAVVYSEGREVMAPCWLPGGVINEALTILGVPQPLTSDRFAAIGLAAVRFNADLIASASSPDDNERGKS